MSIRRFFDSLFICLIPCFLGFFLSLSLISMIQRCHSSHILRSSIPWFLYFFCFLASLLHCFLGCLFICYLASLSPCLVVDFFPSSSVLLIPWFIAFFDSLLPWFLDYFFLGALIPWFLGFCIYSFLDSLKPDFLNSWTAFAILGPLLPLTNPWYWVPVGHSFPWCLDSLIP